MKTKLQISNDGLWSNKGSMKLMFYLFYVVGSDEVANEICYKCLKRGWVWDK